MLRVHREQIAWFDRKDYDRLANKWATEVAQSAGSATASESVRASLRTAIDSGVAHGITGDDELRVFARLWLLVAEDRASLPAWAQETLSDVSLSGRSKVHELVMTARANGVADSVILDDASGDR